MKKCPFIVFFIFNLLLSMQLNAKTTSISTEKIEKIIFKLVNQERKKKGLKSYRHYKDLEELARIHSQNMIKHSFFSHSDHQGLRPNNRKVKYFPTLLGGIGENIAYHFGNSEQEIAINLMKSWMNSPGHRANILKRNYSHMGVGIVRKGKYFYGTQVFGDLSAKMLSKLPEVVPYGKEMKLKWEFLGSFPKDKITIFVHFPDRSAKYYLKSGTYYTGLGKYEPEWDGESFTITVKFDKGKGFYKLSMGSYGRFYPGGLKIMVK